MSKPKPRESHYHNRKMLYSFTDPTGYDSDVIIVGEIEPPTNKTTLLNPDNGEEQKKTKMKTTPTATKKERPTKPPAKKNPVHKTGKEWMSRTKARKEYERKQLLLGLELDEIKYFNKTDKQNYELKVGSIVSKTFMKNNIGDVKVTIPDVPVLGIIMRLKDDKGNYSVHFDNGMTMELNCYQFDFLTNYPRKGLDGRKDDPAVKAAAKKAGTYSGYDSDQSFFTFYNSNGNECVDDDCTFMYTVGTDEDGNKVVTRRNKNRRNQKKIIRGYDAEVFLLEQVKPVASNTRAASKKHKAST
jgi:hypothetical protein